jgi:CRP-like cAMP-binding protein
MSDTDISSKPEFDPQTFLGKPDCGVALDRFQKNQQIHVQGDTADTVGYIRRGAVKATILSGLGKEAIVGIFREGQFFGEASLGNFQVRTATIVALEDCLITQITRERMLSLLVSEPDFAVFFLIQLVSRNVRLEEDLTDQLVNPSEKRLARLLLLLANAEGRKPITLDLSQEALADMVGTTRSRVSTFMNQFREKGFISYNSHTGQLEVNAELLRSVLREAAPMLAFSHR